MKKKILIKWINLTFYKNNPIDSLEQLSNSSKIYRLLHIIDKEFFCNKTLLKENSSFKNILNEISQFYLFYLGMKIKNVDEYELDKIIDLVIGIAVQSNREKYLLIINTMDAYEISEIFNSLTEIVIDIKEEDMKEKISKLEKANHILSKENDEYKIKLNYTLKTYNDNPFPDNYSEALASTECESYNNDIFEKINSEMKKEYTRIIEILTNKLNFLEKENYALKTKNTKIDLLYEIIDDYLFKINSLKIKLINVENCLKQKNTLLKKFEEDNSFLKFKLDELNKLFENSKLNLDKKKSYQEEYINKRNDSNLSNLSHNNKVNVLKEEIQKLVNDNKILSEKLSRYSDDEEDDCVNYDSELMSFID